MLRARRVAFVAVLVLAGALALTGCRSQPGVAVYVGSAQYTQKYVDGLADQLANLPQTAKADARTQVVEWLIRRDLDRRLVAEHKWDAPSVDMASATSQFVQALQVGDPATAQKVVSASRPLITLFAEFNAYSGVTGQHASEVRPTQADLTDLYERAKAAGVVQEGQDELAFLQGLNPQQQQSVTQVIGLKRLYAAEIKKTDVTVNPKYGAAGLVLLQANNHPLVELPLKPNGSRSPVTAAPLDASVAPASAPNG